MENLDSGHTFHTFYRSQCSVVSATILFSQSIDSYSSHLVTVCIMECVNVSDTCFKMLLLKLFVLVMLSDHVLCSVYAWL